MIRQVHTSLTARDSFELIEFYVYFRDPEGSIIRTAETGRHVNNFFFKAHQSS